MRVFPYNLSVFLALFSLAILGNVRAVPFPDPWRSDRIAGSAHRIWTRGARSAREGPRKLGPNEHQIWPQNVCPVALDPGVLGLWKTCKNFTFVTFERLRAPATPGSTSGALLEPRRAMPQHSRALFAASARPLASLASLGNVHYMQFRFQISGDLIVLPGQCLENLEPRRAKRARWLGTLRPSLVPLPGLL